MSDESLDKLDHSKSYRYEELGEKFLDSLRLTKGIIYVACENVGIARQTYYNWMEAYPDFKAQVEAINEATIDFVESKLIEKVSGISVRKGVDEESGEDIVYDLPPSDTAIIFFLKTRAKKRGYIERSEFANPPGESFSLTLDLK